MTLSQLITITIALLIMMPWRNQQEPTSVPDKIIGNGRCRVHLYLNAFTRSMTGKTKKQYMSIVTTKPKRVSTFFGSSNCKKNVTSNEMSRKTGGRLAVH